MQKCRLPLAAHGSEFSRYLYFKEFLAYEGLFDKFTEKFGKGNFSENHALQNMIDLDFELK